MSFQAGDLRHRVTLQSPRRDQTSTGESVVEWIAVGDRWAEVVPLGSRELERSSQQQSQTTHRVRMRWDATVKADWRLLFEGQILNIDGDPTNPDGRRVEMVLNCREVGNQ